MLSQFTNYFLLFILSSFYIAVVIRFYQYLIDYKNNDKLYKILSFLWSVIIAPCACFYGIMDIIADSYEDDNEEQDIEDGEEY